jgi:solute carrier family 35 protein E3
MQPPNPPARKGGQVDDVESGLMQRQAGGDESGATVADSGRKLVGSKHARGSGLALAPGTKLAAWQVYALIATAPAAGIALILANKALMTEFDFKYPGLLVAVHFSSNYVVLTMLGILGVFELRQLAWQDRLLLGAAGACAIVLGTTSLRINSLGSFLATNMLTTPMTVLLRFFWEGKQYQWRVIGALGVVVVGVGLHSLADKDLSTGWGLPVALVSVTCNAAYQVLQKMRQDALALNAAQLLQQLSPVVMVAGACLSLATECWGEGSVLERDWTAELWAALGLTAAMAVASNVSAGALIGVTSPVTFQVMGYVKTCILFLVAVVWEVLLKATPHAASTGQLPSGQNAPVSGMPPLGSLVGVPLALSGAILYGLWVKG